MSEDVRRVGHMLEAAQHIEQFLKGRRRQLVRDEILKSALYRKFEVLGEAAAHVSTTYRAAHPTIPWKRIIAFRNVLIHAYDRILLDGLLKAIEELPQVKAELEKVLRGI